MNPPANLKEHWERSSTRRLLCWLFSWRTARALLVAGGALVTIIGLFYAVEDWRGARALNRYRAEWERKGETFDAKSLIPAPVPDDQNFAMVPLLKPLLDYERTPGPVRWRDPDGRERLSKVSAYLTDRKGRQTPHSLTNLVEWQAFFRGNTNYPQPAAPQSPAQDVLTALSKFDPELKQLQDAAARPYSRFPVHYSEAIEGDPYALLLPHLAPMKGLTSVLTLRSLAHLDAGQPHEALADLKLGLRLSDAFKTEPILISHLVRIATLAISLQAANAGLARHAWTDAELAGLEEELAGINLLAENKLTMHAERAWDLVGLDYYQRKWWPYFPFDESGNAERDNCLEHLLLRLMPTGWVRQNEVVICRLIQDHALAGVDEKGHRVSPDRLDGLEQAFGSRPRGPYTFLAAQFIPALGRASEKTARGQTLVDQCVVACALERYRLANGRFPENLQALVPRFVDKVPNDVIDGAPLRYRLQGDGTYLLYSIGWDQKDNGGQPAPKADKASPESRQGDWIWPSL